MERKNAIDILKEILDSVSDESKKEAINIAIKELKSRDAYQNYLDMNQRYDTLNKFIKQSPPECLDKKVVVCIDDGMGYCANGPLEVIDICYDKESDVVTIWA